jgi:hypothetical protein
VSQPWAGDRVAPVARDRPQARAGYQAPLARANAIPALIA